MAEKITFSSNEQQIIFRVCSEFGFTAEEAECVKQIVEIIAQTNSVKTRHRAIISLTAKISPERHVLMGKAVKVILTVFASLQTRQTMAHISRQSASLN